jgi:uncharacterized membrane protein SpoIIM required for sporulation
MAEDDFVAARRGDWDALALLLGRKRALHRLRPSEIARAAALYRALCADLMRAEAARYGRELTTFLDALAARAHNALYAAPPYRWHMAVALVTRDFPRTLRRRARFLVVAALLFLVPAAIGAIGGARSPEFAAQVLSEQTLVEMENAYAKGFDSGRDAGSDTNMAGFYVWNNVGIAFRCFATGILFGLGSLFFLLYNGLTIGTVFGAVARAGHARNILTFCAGHAPLELTAIVIAGAAGLQMGFALIDTGGRTRLGSLRAQGREIAQLVIGAALMLGIAALVEGFWSPSSAPAPVKWAVAGVNAIAVTAYFVLVGRREPA